MLEIECAGERLTLLPEKAVFWPRQSALIIADLHLGKAAAFRTAGVPVPETTTANDLQRLSRLIAASHAQQLIVLGDLFHARAGLQPAMLDTVSAWREATPCEIVLVPGNHDRKSGPPPNAWRIQERTEGWILGPFVFCHEPREDRNGYVMAGHLHPALALREKFGAGVRAPCFCFGQRRAILPAFGSFTGTSLLPPQRADRFFVVNPDERQILEVAF